MKTLYLIALTVLTAVCAHAQSAIDTVRLDCTGQPLPKIQHVIEMKVLADTLFSYMKPKAASGSVSFAVRQLTGKTTG